MHIILACHNMPNYQVLFKHGSYERLKRRSVSLAITKPCMHTVKYKKADKHKILKEEGVDRDQSSLFHIPNDPLKSSPKTN